MQARKGDGFALLMFVLPPCVRWTNFREIRRRFGKIFEKPVGGQFSGSKGISRHKISEVSAHFTTAETDDK